MRTQQLSRRVSVPLDFPPPAREWYQTESGLWTSREWTKASFDAARGSGAFEKTVTRPA